MHGNQLKELQTEQLTNAFRIFNELSQNLSESYQCLEERVSMLHKELAFARSERLQTLEEKEKLASRLEKILTALPAGIIVLDCDGKILDCNAVAVEFLGEPLLDQDWLEVFARSLIPVFGNPHEYQLKNGKQISMTVSREWQNGNNHSGQIVLLSDVSEMRHLQDMLNQKKQLSAMGEMVASMAHQVRTPLATAILYASQLSHSALDQEKRQKFAAKILERLNYLERQVTDMLIFAKDGRLSMECFFLKDLLDQLQESADDYIGHRPIQLKILNETKNHLLVGNEHALRGALINLLNNAIDAIGQNGMITVTVSEQRNNTLIVTVQDNGPGIPKSQQQRIFEPFFTTKTQGIGLGLAVVDNVVKAHGGEIQFHSIPGIGCTFILTLPCINESTTSLPGGFSGKQHHQQESRYETI